MKGPKVALVMIVRNEGSRLDRCLNSVKDAVDEIVVVDTGSSDNTLDIARKYTSKVYSYQWENDFSAARNYAIEKTTAEWVLSLDADEWLEADSHTFRSLIGQRQYSAFCLPLFAQKDTNQNYEYDRFLVLRLFRNIYRYKNPVHEYVSINNSNEIGYTQYPVIWHTAVPRSERNARRGRNITILKSMLAKNEADPYINYYLGIEWVGLWRVDLAIAAFQNALQKFAVEQVVFRTPAIRYLIYSYKNADKLDAASSLCIKECQNYPDYCDLYFDNGVLFELKGEYDVAIKWFKEAARLETPQPAFYHTDGTNGYLAYYHLGFCSEKLGLFKAAEQYYELALENNSNYYYPLLPLVLLKMVRQNIKEVLKYIRTKKYLEDSEIAEKTAELFLTAGYPDAGKQCFDNLFPQSDTGLELFARCQIYSGEADCAVQSIAQFTKSGIEPTTESLIDEIVALLILERYKEAGQRLRNFWQRKNNRYAFRALFCLYKKMFDNKLLPLTNQQDAAVLIDILDRSLHVRNGNLDIQKQFALLVRTASVILSSNPASMMLLIREICQKQENVKQSLEYTFAVLRG